MEYGLQDLLKQETIKNENSERLLDDAFAERLGGIYRSKKIKE
jgi:hypothetical protein